LRPAFAAGFSELASSSTSCSKLRQHISLLIEPPGNMIEENSVPLVLKLSEFAQEQVPEVLILNTLALRIGPAIAHPLLVIFCNAFDDVITVGRYDRPEEPLLSPIPAFQGGDGGLQFGTIVRVDNPVALQRLVYMLVFASENDTASCDGKRPTVVETTAVDEDEVCGGI
jgi:hypothetical protein